MMGMGVLGRHVAHIWKNRNIDATVLGETRTDACPGELSLLKIRPVLAKSTDLLPPLVVFRVPPSGENITLQQWLTQWSAERALVLISHSLPLRLFMAIGLKSGRA